MKPTALYGSEVRSAYKPCFHSKSVDELFEMSLKNNSEFDKVRMRFCKNVLGMHSKAYSLGVLSELGRLPLKLMTFTSCIDFGSILSNQIVIHVFLRLTLSNYMRPLIVVARFPL